MTLSTADDRWGRIAQLIEYLRANDDAAAEFKAFNAEFILNTLDEFGVTKADFLQACEDLGYLVPEGSVLWSV